ncbi:MAG: DUF47 domain-containing protein [Methanomicrobiales archaeon]
MGIKEWVIPQERVFFDFLERLAETVVEGADLLVEFLKDYSDAREKSVEMKAIEHRGDEVTHEIYEHLNRTFITPIEPEEISRLATALDDILDTIDGVTHQMDVYGIQETDEHMVELAKLIQLCVYEVHGAVRGIRTLKKPAEVEERCIEINRLENLADDVLGHAIRDLFQGDDPIEIIKLKDIYENLEVATDKCEDAADALSDIAIRHS